MTKKKNSIPTKVETIRHKDKRTNIPTEELRDFVADEERTPKTMLYPRDPLTRFIGADPLRARLVWQILKDIASEAMIAGGRVYGGGLLKLEPGELASIPAPGITALLQS